MLETGSPAPRSRSGMPAMTTSSRSSSELTIFPAQFPNLALRALLADSWARMYRGELDDALAKLKTAKQITHRPGFNDIDRAGVLCRIGAVRVKRGSISRALNDLTLALELCNRSGPAQRPPSRRDLRLALALLPAPARLQRRARRHRGGARALRLDRRGRRRRRHQLPRRLDRRARGQVPRRPLLRREGAGSLRPGRRPRQRRPRPQRPRRDHVPARPARRGDRLPEAGGLDALRRRRRRGDRIRGLLARAGLSPHGPARAGRRTGSHRPRAARRPRGRPRGDRQRPARSRPRADGAGPGAGGGRVVRRRRGFLRRARVPSLLAAAWMARGELALDRDDSVSAAQLYRRAAEALSDFHF